MYFACCSFRGVACLEGRSYTLFGGFSAGCLAWSVGDLLCSRPSIEENRGAYHSCAPLRIHAVGGAVVGQWGARQLDSGA